MIKEMINKIVICFLILILFSCKENSSNKNCDYYVIGAFFSNNKLNAVDSSIHFQHICHFSFLLNINKLEIYKYDSKLKTNQESSTIVILNDEKVKRFKKIVNTISKNNTTKNNQSLIYDGLTYVVSSNNCNETNFSIANTGIKKSDEDFLMEILNISKHEKIIKPSNLMIKEKYFMSSLLHQTNYIETSIEKF